MMDKYKKIAVEEIEKKEKLIYDVSDKIWDYAEISLQENKSCKLYCKVMGDEGFEVRKGLGGITTAFMASFGSGKPVIGLLAEYDALSGIPKCDVEKKEHLDVEKLEESITSDSSAHGCGHNLLGAGAMAAAIGIKKYLQESGHEGTIILYGCPGEEGCASKAFFARDGIWNDLDAALTWHPADCNEVVTGSSNSCIQVKYTFKGVSSHASAAPEKGRSALDAVELMNIGVQFLREHMSDKARVHYAITDAGGISPNVVQARAQVLYMVRSNHVKEALELQKRVDKIAEGAALMTDTTVERTFIDGMSDTVTNRTLEKIAYSNFEELGVPSHNEAELQIAEKIALTYDGRDKNPGIGSSFDEEYARKSALLRKENATYMNDFLLPHFLGDAFEASSTDVGDVSNNCPTLQIHVASWPNGCPGHSWQNVACGGTSIGRKAALHAGKVLAATAIDLFENKEIIKESTLELMERTKDGYNCPIPEGALAKI
ncbi:aminobenzoyl-glutamate utilization protein B [Butyrivibrio proteoclasticus]|uniref:Aminobenzoyl-glutamate utilization protein B n=2 Tax=Butyrivibrio proteoclasticus TaxID=43305 RepID=A0A1I5ST33_9FIRM|nr:aminobenzoyl-glutamate utilization protein B [Butyrivibrio proteoclasticus]